VVTSATGGGKQSFLIRLVLRQGDCVGNFREILVVFSRQLLRPEFKGHFVDLAGELEWTLVAILDHRNTRARVLTDVEVLVFRKLDWGCVFQLFLGHGLIIHE